MKILLFLAFISFQATITASTASKPDLQKVYNEAQSWTKSKLKEMPSIQQIAELVNPSKVGVCRGQKDKAGELAIAPGCPKKNHNKKEQHIHAAMTDPKILVFVSFSMPRASLNALSKEAEKFGAVLVMRGLKGDSFQETQAAFQGLGTEERSGIEINPELFETYQIKQVPMFVRVKTSTEGEFQEIGRLSGNVSLSFAAQKLQELP